MRYRLAIVSLALLGATAFAPAPLARRGQARSDEVTLAGIAGDWHVKSLQCYNIDGKLHRTEIWHTVRIEKESWTFIGENQGHNSTYRFTLTQGKPAAMDFRFGNDQTVCMRASARIRGGALEVVYVPNGSMPRPTDFDNPPEHCNLFKLTRKR